MHTFKDITYPSSNGKNTIHARMCLPEGKAAGIVQISHGITEHIEMYDEFMAFLAENGHIAVGNDHLGHGHSYSDPADRGFFAEKNGWNYAAADIRRLTRIMRREYPGLFVTCYGFSMGSFLARTCLIKYPDEFDAAVICGTGHRTSIKVDIGYRIASAAADIKGARGSGRKISAATFASYNDRVENVRTPHDWVSTDPAEVDKFNEDPLCRFIPTAGLYRDMFGGIIYVSDPEKIKKMNKDIPVLFLSGSDDPVGAYGEGVKTAYDAFLDAGMKNVSIKICEGARHNLLAEPIRNEVMTDILRFIGNAESNSKTEGAAE